MTSSTLRQRIPAWTILDPKIVWPAVGSAFIKLDPRLMTRNPVMFVVEAVALLTTLYGAVVSNLVFLPIADKLTNRATEDGTNRTLIIDALVMIREGKNPSTIRDELSSFLPLQGARGLGVFLMNRIGPLRRAVMREGVNPLAAQPRLMRGEALA